MHEIINKDREKQLNGLMRRLHQASALNITYVVGLATGLLPELEIRDLTDPELLMALTKSQQLIKD